MNIYFISDLHITVTKPESVLGTAEEWFETQTDAIKQVAKIVGKKDLLVIAGDIIDSFKPRGSQTIVNMLHDNLPPNTVYIEGNHEYHGIGQDYETAHKIGTAGTMKRMKGWTYLEKEPFVWKDFVIHPFPFRHNRTLEHNEIIPGKKNIAVGHFLSFEKEVPQHWNSSGVRAKDIIKDFPEYDAIVIGDNHSTFLVDGKYLSPGSLTRRSANQMKHKPCVWKFDGESFEPIYLKIKEAEEALTREHIVAEKTQTERMQSWTVSVEEGKGFTGNFNESVDNYMGKINSKLPVKNRMHGYIAKCS